MSDQAPVCHLPSNTVAATPGPVSIPNIPAPQPNINALVASVNALRQAVQLLANQFPKNPNQGITNNAVSKGTFQQTSVTYEEVKVYQNNDPSTGNFVTVKQINSLVMKDPISGSQWKWTRNG